MLLLKWRIEQCDHPAKDSPMQLSHLGVVVFLMRCHVVLYLEHCKDGPKDQADDGERSKRKGDPEPVAFASLLEVRVKIVMDFASAFDDGSLPHVGCWVEVPLFVERSADK